MIVGCWAERGRGRGRNILGESPLFRWNSSKVNISYVRTRIKVKKQAVWKIAPKMKFEADAAVWRGGGRVAEIESLLLCWRTIPSCL